MSVVTALPGRRGILLGELPFVRDVVVLPQHVAARAEGGGGEHDADADSYRFLPRAA